jgi:CheY-like chemotaxis protein/transcriptional regulator with XRE-family HTH domain
LSTVISIYFCYYYRKLTVEAVLTIEEALGIVIRRLRREHNFSQEKLSASSNLDRTFISNIEGGKQQPSLLSIFALASAFGTSAACIMFETEFILSVNGSDILKSGTESSKFEWTRGMVNIMGGIKASYKGNETILVVDDEKLVLNMLSDFLAGCGYNVIRAENGQVALERYQQSPGSIHLVIMDVVMPHKDGIVSAREIKQINDRAKIILMSGYHPEHLKVGDTFTIIRKPFSPIEMLKLIRSTLDDKPYSVIDY